MSFDIILLNDFQYEKYAFNSTGNITMYHVTST